MPILNVPGEIHIPNEILDEEQIEAALALYNEHNSWNSESHQSIYKSIFANLIQYVMHIIFKNRTLPDPIKVNKQDIKLVGKYLSWSIGILY